MSLRRFIGPLVIGISGTVVLASLGFWQLQRLEWKEGILAEMDERLSAPPIALPDHPEEEAHRFRSVVVEGDFVGEEFDVFTNINEIGQAVRAIAAFETSDGRRIMVERGVLPGVSATQDASTAQGVTIVGNLHWPDEVDRWTPAQDLKTGLFFGRDLKQLAQELDAEEILIVAREVSVNDPPLVFAPVTTEGIPNNHLGYAVQWFGLALVWAGMTLFLLWRTAKRTD